MELTPESCLYMHGVVRTVLYKGNRRLNFHTRLAGTEVVETDRAKHRPDRGGQYICFTCGSNTVEHRNYSCWLVRSIFFTLSFGFPNPTPDVNFVIVMSSLTIPFPFSYRYSYNTSSLPFPYPRVRSGEVQDP